jgi:hypothetical protein
MNKLFIITYRPATHNGRKTGRTIAYTVANPRPGASVASLRATIMGPYGPIGARTFNWDRIVSIVPAHMINRLADTPGFEDLAKKSTEAPKEVAA